MTYASELDALPIRKPFGLHAEEEQITPPRLLRQSIKAKVETPTT
ncbi:hypothetical protein [Acinetobacter ursingii]|nr:hypothetical protein [Acinetobacter ursingii]EXD36061.1 hypothetical protein J500_1419 [Acinetobacter sp. 479375]MDU4392609.1 hypothetical protein [Acinetobacter ursingii]